MNKFETITDDNLEQYIKIHHKLEDTIESMNYILKEIILCKKLNKKDLILYKELKEFNTLGIK